MCAFPLLGWQISVIVHIYLKSILHFLIGSLQNNQKAKDHFFLTFEQTDLFSFIKDFLFWKEQTKYVLLPIIFIHTKVGFSWIM